MSDNKPIRVGFLGYGTRALDALMEHELFDVRYFWAPEKRLCDDVFNAAKRYEDSLQLTIVHDNAHLVSLLSDVHDVDCFLMNACPIILKKDVLDLMPFYNIHPGRLENNRGHHPHLWTVLLGEETSVIALHKVCPGIDEGLVIAEKEEAIPADANEEDVLNLLEDEIPYLLDRWYLYLTHQADALKQVYAGEYRRVMIPEDYRIDLNKCADSDFELTMKRKIRARSLHHGAFFLYEGNRIYVDSIVSEEKVTGADVTSDSLLNLAQTKLGQEYENDAIYSVDLESAEYVTLRTPNCIYRFHINKIQPDSV